MLDAEPHARVSEPRQDTDVEVCRRFLVHVEILGGLDRVRRHQSDAGARQLEGRGEDQARHAEPRDVGVAVVRPTGGEPPDGGDQHCDADERVQAPRHRAQQEVGRDAERGRGAEDLESESGPLAQRVHPAAASGRAPKRRSRVRNSAIALARSAGLKSGHMRSVKHSSA